MLCLIYLEAEALTLSAGVCRLDAVIGDAA